MKRIFSGAGWLSKKASWHLFFALVYGLPGSLIVLIGGYMYLLNARPDLSIWHEAKLEGEFTAKKHGGMEGLQAYRALEDGLFEQLEAEVYQHADAKNQSPLNRYYPESRMDPRQYPKNWNRSSELVPDKARAGIVLLHGLSDSPYSLKRVGEHFHSRGFHVVFLRLPGHGTVPSALLKVKWEDWTAAVRLAVRDLRAKLKDCQPLYLGGYSNGAALAVEYALAGVAGEEQGLAEIEALVLFSPALQVAKVAALAKWQGRLGYVSGLNKLAWNDIGPEFDPYKYNSFTVNAGQQIYELIGTIQARMSVLRGKGKLQHFPRVLAFVSALDATVPPQSIVDVLLDKLPAQKKNQLVVFGTNHDMGAEVMLKDAAGVWVEKMIKKKDLKFDLTLISNGEQKSVQGGHAAVVALERKGGADDSLQRKVLQGGWPANVFSLSHLAVPMPADDPIYGEHQYEGDEYPWITLGSITVKGERGSLQFGDNYFVRLRYNPFHSYLLERIDAFVK
ncbi:MAG: alpha/beta fold hydrolase [Verrucomicrobiales bacterium]|nr:alpha/beta fold hydrolase [Verrucomicrobiales bacterium]